jgi:transposase
VCPPEIRSVGHISNEGTVHMIVIGVDTHKRSHVLVALEAATGATRGQLRIAATDDGTLEALRFAAELDDVRVWAVEDCRHVSGRLERGLLASGEQVVRVAPGLTETSRRVVREPGKSDPIDATAIARAALREGIDTLPVAHLDEQALEIRVLNDYRDQIVRTQPPRLPSALAPRAARPGPGSQPRAGQPRPPAGPSAGRPPTRAPATQPAGPCREADPQANRSDHRRGARDARRDQAGIEAHCPALLAEHGCGPVTAAIIIGHTAGAKRFATDARFARHAGTAPIPASSGNTQRHRLHRGGNRQLNRAIHIIALSLARTDPTTRAYLERKHAEGKSKREAIRCLKRHVARHIWRILYAAETARPDSAPAHRETVLVGAPAIMRCVR